MWPICLRFAPIVSPDMTCDVIAIGDRRQKFFAYFAFCCQFQIYCMESLINSQLLSIPLDHFSRGRPTPGTL